MVFAFVLILFGFYWIDKIREREQTPRTQSRGLLFRPAANLIFRLQFMCVRCTCVLGSWEGEGEGVACQGKSLWFFGDPATCLPIPLSLPLPLGLCLNICNMLRERAQFEFSGGSMQSVWLCVCQYGCVCVCACLFGTTNAFPLCGLAACCLRLSFNGIPLWH